MRFDNLIKLKSWRIETDKYGSEFKNLSDEIIAVELKSGKKINENVFLYCNVKICLDHYFDVNVKKYLNQYHNVRYFIIPKCRSFSITYKTNGDNYLFFGIEENMNTYNFHYVLPPSKEWTTKKIKINDPGWIITKNSNLNLHKITGFLFFFKYSGEKEITDTLYIKEFIINGYEIVSLKYNKGPVYKKYLMKKNILNNLKVFYLKDRGKEFNIFNKNRLYCIYPFYQFVVNNTFNAVCCWTNLNSNLDFINNQKLIDDWYGEKFDKIRESIKNLDYSECNLNDCMKLNVSNENFKKLSELKRNFPQIADYIEGKTKKYKELPVELSIGFDSTCNLTCKSCTINKTKKQPIEVSQKYIREIEEIGENIERLSIANYGDPFGTPSYRNWLINFPANKFPKLKTIQIITNAILWTEKIWSKVSDTVKKCDIEAIISIDGATKETYECNRGNAKFEKLVENLFFISNLRVKNKIKSLLLYFVVQKNNYKEIPLIIDFAKQYKFDCVFFKQILNWGSYTKEEFNKINVFDKTHPDHKNLKQIYKKVKASKIEETDVKFIFKI